MSIKRAKNGIGDSFSSFTFFLLFLYGLTQKGLALEKALVHLVLFNPFRLYPGNKIGLVQAVPLSTLKFDFKYYTDKDKNSNEGSYDKEKSSIR
jgi:hypothetical protein